MNKQIKLAGEANCTGCAACYNKCNQNAIKMIADKEGFLFPEIDDKKCISCHSCEKVCPVLFIKHERYADSGEAFAVQVKDKALLYNSASGGAFSVFAKRILEKNGIVYATSCDNKEVIFERITSWGELQRVRKSKYVASSINDTYRSVEKDLKQDKYVLFTGLPCQTEGLLSFLNKEYEKLYTIDLICHGVPSQKIYQAYIASEEKKQGEKFIRVFFHGKKHGWGLWDIVYQNFSGQEVQKVFVDDPYCKLYLTNQIMRRSCYNCHFRNILEKRCDATIGDCWGFDKLNLNETFDLDGKAGISIVFCHTQRAKIFLEESHLEANVQSVDFWRSVVGNWGALGEPITIPSSRDTIYIDFIENGFDFIAEKYDKQIAAEDRSSWLRKKIRNMKILRGFMKKRRIRQYEEMIQMVKSNYLNNKIRR